MTNSCILPSAVNPHRRYERRQAIWLFISFCLLGMMTLAVVVYAALQAGLLRNWRRR